MLVSGYLPFFPLVMRSTQSGNVIFWDITLRRPIVQKIGLYTDGVIEAGFVCDDTAFSFGIRCFCQQ